jgi:alcohol dehydrogenase class IV
MTAFGITLPGRILFGRGEVARAPALIVGFGQRVLVVHGATTRHADWLSDQIAALGGEVRRLACPAEPTLQMVNAALEGTRAFAPQVVVGIGGGSALDLAKALAALIPAPGGAMDHLEVVGKGAALFVDPLPFVAIPTTAGTGAEATKNAVIGLPDHRRKVSLRDDRMLARIAIVDPALTDGCPWPVTLASGLDALVQVIEPFVSCRATRFTDALTLPCISLGLAALRVLQSGEDPAARDNLAWVSHCGGLALANAGLGAVHGLAGPIGGVSSAPHGAVCGALISPVLAVNLARARQTQNTTALARLDQVCALIADGLGGPVDAAPQTLARWITAAGLPGLSAQGFAAKDHDDVASAALGSSSMKGNPIALSKADLVAILETEAR